MDTAHLCGGLWSGLGGPAELMVSSHLCSTPWSLLAVLGWLFRSLLSELHEPRLAGLGAGDSGALGWVGSCRELSAKCSA